MLLCLDIEFAIRMEMYREFKVTKNDDRDRCHQIHGDKRHSNQIDLDRYLQ